MSEDQGIRLVALIEEQGYYGNPPFKVTNFLSDIKIVAKWDESGTKHLRDKNGRYQFDIIKTVTTQLPYTKTLEDLKVVVGKNGAGKTSLINKIIHGEYFQGQGYRIFQKGEKFWTDNDSNHSLIAIPFDYTCPNIIKFSNAEELYKLYIPERLGSIDASYLENFISSGNKDDAKQLSLVEITHQVQFVEKFQDEIKEFVDYTQKGIAIDFDGEELPRYALYVDIDQENFVNRYQVRILLDYFSILINHIIYTEYGVNNHKKKIQEKLLKEHLRYLKDEDNVSLQYQSIYVDYEYSRFLPNPYSISLLNRIMPKFIRDAPKTRFWIRLWHRLYVIDLYMNLIMEDGNQAIKDKYKADIEKIIDLSKMNISMHLGLNKLFMSDLINIAEYLDGIKTIVEPFREFKGQWGNHKQASFIVAQAISYTSYFELKKREEFVSYSLRTDRIWDKLRIVGIPDKEIKQLKTLGELLKNYIAKPDFSTVHSIVDIVSQLKTIDVKKYLQLKWSGLSSGELALLKSFSHLFLAKKKLEKSSYRNVDNNSVLLLLDEVDLGLHPEWQRRWVSVALPVIEKIFEGKHLQIIMTTHSPILLSDIYQENVLLLDKGGQEVKGIEKTFGQNIYSLFKDSFFLKKLMGDHAYNRIEETMAFLHHKLGNLRDPLPETNSYHALSEEQQKIWVEKIIASVGEPIIANQLRDLYERAYPEKSEEDRIRDEIRRLQKQLENLRGGDSHDAS